MTNSTYSSFRSATRAARGAARGGALPVAGLIGCYGLTMAFTSPTMSLFLSTEVHASALLIGCYFAVGGVASILVSQLTGRLSDRLRDRRVLIGLAALCGIAAGLTCAFVREYVILLLLGTALFAMNGVAFSQTFAYANEYATDRGRSVTVFTTVIRSFFSAAWIVGPPVALFIVARYGFGTLFTAVAGLSLSAAVIGRWGLRPVTRPPMEATAGGGLAALGLGGVGTRLWLLLGVIFLVAMANQMYSIGFPLYVTGERHLSGQLVGWMAGLCAALEIPVMLVAGRIADRAGKSALLLGAGVIAVVFFCLLPLAATPATLLGLQALNAAWVAVIMSIPMVMVQEEFAGGAGASSSLYGSVFMSSGLFAGTVTGIVASLAGYGGVFWACAAMSAVAVALLAARQVNPHRIR